MKSQKVNLVDSVVAAVDLTRRRFVGFDGNVCANGVKALGVVDADTEERVYFVGATNRDTGREQVNGRSSVGGGTRCMGRGVGPDRDARVDHLILLGYVAALED